MHGDLLHHSRAGHGYVTEIVSHRPLLMSRLRLALGQVSFNMATVHEPFAAEQNFLFKVTQ
jgi:hypothetical protein